MKLTNLLEYKTKQQSTEKNDFFFLSNLQHEKKMSRITLISQLETLRYFSKQKSISFNKKLNLFI